MKLIAGIFVAALLLLLASCDKTPAPPVVFGVSAWTGYESAYLAQEQGYFAGANLRLAGYGSDSEVIKAFREHAVQVAAMPLGAALLLRRDIPDLKIVLLLDVSNGADALLAQPGITTMQQLQGRSVGVDKSGQGAYFLSMALQSAGMQAGQVNSIALSGNEQEAAFRAHKVDAVVAAGAGRSRLLESGAKVLFDSSSVPGKIYDVLVVRDDEIGKYHGELMGLVRGWQRALEFIAAQPDQSTQSMATREKVTPAQFGKAMQGIELLGVQRNRDLMLGDTPAVGAAVDALQRFLLGQGLINMGADTSALLDTTLLPKDKS